MHKRFTSLLYILSTVIVMYGCSSNKNNSVVGNDTTKNKDTQTSNSDDLNNPDNLPLDKIKLPDGFKISIFANKVNNARSMVRGDKGTIFVGNRSGGSVYAVADNNGDYKADKVYTIASGLTMPCGVAFRKGSLYVAEVNRVLRYDNIEDNLDNPPKPVVVYDKYPTHKWHGWKFIAFGPDDKLYVPVGAPCNICDSAKINPKFASITRMNPDGSDVEVYASGVRNSVGFAWHPDTKELWFTDNGRDNMGDDMPSDELNHAPKKGMHFGYPYCHQGDTKDPKLNSKPCSDFTPPAKKLGAHVAALGMRFYTGKMFPASYSKKAFIAMHGSWNRSKKVGYKLAFVNTDGGKVTEFKTFAEGWLEQEKQLAWGRPVDVLQMPDGSLLVSDDMANVIYRITYKK